MPDVLQQWWNGSTCLMLLKRFLAVEKGTDKCRLKRRRFLHTNINAENLFISTAKQHKVKHQVSYIPQASLLQSSDANSSSFHSWLVHVPPQGTP